MSTATIPDFSNAAMSYMAQALAGQVASLLKDELARVGGTSIQPMLLDVKQAAVYLGRSEQSVQHIIADKGLPVVRHGRRVHLHRPDLDDWIEKNKF
jgi:excisionase family DNA binding protein